MDAALQEGKNPACCKVESPPPNLSVFAVLCVCVSLGEKKRISNSVRKSMYLCGQREICNCITKVDILKWKLQKYCL